MSNPVVAQVLKSGAILYQAPVGETPPAITTVAYGGAWGGNWTRVGFTKAPLSILYEDEQFDVEVEEHLGPINRWRIKEDATLETVLAELTATYLQLAASEAYGVTTGAAGIGVAGYEQTGLGDTSALAQHAWGFEGLYVDGSGNSLPVRLFVWKGTARFNGALEFSKKSGDYVGIPLQIKALMDTTQTAGERLLRFQRATAPAT